MSGFRRYRQGQRIGERITVVDVLAATRGRHPVYLAWDHAAWCPVVCKIFRNSRRAAREHEVLAQVAHPNIVKTLGTYEPDAMLMEYLPGKLLDAHLASLRGGRMPLADALRTAVHVGGALQYVHHKGFVHLDVKPSNIIISHNRPILFDFGTARKIGAKRPPVPQGTSAYMPPEECSLAAVSPAADVFSLGLTLFELLTGHIPYPAKTRKIPYPQMVMPARPLRELRPDLPRGLEALIAQCLAREPQQRPEIRQLLRELHAFIQSGPKMWPALLDSLVA